MFYPPPYDLKTLQKKHFSFMKIMNKFSMKQLTIMLLFILLIEAYEKKNP